MDDHAFSKIVEKSLDNAGASYSTVKGEKQRFIHDVTTGILVQIESEFADAKDEILRHHKDVEEICQILDKFNTESGALVKALRSLLG